MPLEFVHQDITTLHCDAIVNPTDPFFSGGGGTDLAVHTAAGAGLAKACEKLSALAMRDVAVTEAFLLPCRYIIHTFGPVWSGGTENEPMLLRSCYLNALIAAKKEGAESIAFPLISSGSFGFPKDRVLQIALSAISDFLNYFDYDMKVYLCVYDRHAYELSLGIELDRYLADRSATLPSGDVSPEALSEWMKGKKDSFAVTLGKLIDGRGMEDSECYKAAGVSRKTYWKIYNEENYRPGKRTVFAFAIGLKLSLEEAEQLLNTVGFSFSRSDKMDMIIEFYISRGVYDIYEINATLHQNGLLCLETTA